MDHWFEMLRIQLSGKHQTTDPSDQGGNEGEGAPAPGAINLGANFFFRGSQNSPFALIQDIVGLKSRTFSTLPWGGFHKPIYTTTPQEGCVKDWLRVYKINSWAHKNKMLCRVRACVSLPITKHYQAYRRDSKIYPILGNKEVL